MKFTCNITSEFKINRVLFGSGGSNSIILDVDDKKGEQIIIKVIPDIIHINTKVKPNNVQLETIFYQFFTKKYLLTDRTPHIVGIYNHQNCTQLGKLLKNIRSEKKGCLSYQDKLIKPTYDFGDNVICDLMLRNEMKMLDPVYDVLLLEHCDDDFSRIISWHMQEIKRVNKKNKKLVIEYFIFNLQRILFQIIFTLAIIKEDYPGMMHRDFFVRNILVSFEDRHQTGDYVAYHYKQKIFYLPANGMYAKINDFGMTIIADELEPNIYKMHQHSNKYYHINPFNAKNDLFNLLHDIYDGQNLGTMSINYLEAQLKIPRKDYTTIRDFIGNFIDVDTIDQINKNNPFLLKETWTIDNIKILENTILTPNQYLMKNHFDIYQILPDNANIIQHYNMLE